MTSASGAVFAGLNGANGNLDSNHARVKMELNGSNSRPESNGIQPNQASNGKVSHVSSNGRSDTAAVHEDLLPNRKPRCLWQLDVTKPQESPHYHTKR